MGMGKRSGVRVGPRDGAGLVEPATMESEPEGQLELETDRLRCAHVPPAAARPEDSYHEPEVGNHVLSAFASCVRDLGWKGRGRVGRGVGVSV